MGNALNDPSYYRTAARFLRYVLDPSHGFVVNGVLQEHCEAIALCTRNSLGNRYDITAFKGIFVQAVADWTAATGSHEFEPFLEAQARAVVRNADPRAGPQRGVPIGPQLPVRLFLGAAHLPGRPGRSS